MSFALWIKDPMYRTATASIRRTMEMEEAAALLHAIDDTWKENKTRGWIRKHLEEDLRDRASGVAAQPDVWETVRTTRRAALLVDYVCVVRGIRVALWWSDYKTATCIPLTFSSSQTDDDTGIVSVPVSANPGSSVFNLNATTGHVMVGKNGAAFPGSQWLALQESAKEGWSWAPPACAPSIGSLTVANIHEQILALQPDEPKTGGRLGLWNKLQWLRLKVSLG